MYKCSKCSKQFRATTGTIFEGSKIPLTNWFDAMREMACSKKGMSSIKLSHDIGVTQKTAWYMLQKIRRVLANDLYKNLLEGTIEVETYIGGRKKGGKRGCGTEKTKVFGMLERNGKIRLVKVNDVSSATLHPIIFKSSK